MKFLKKCLFLCLVMLASAAAFAGFSQPAQTKVSYAAFESYNFSKFINFSSAFTLSENNISKIDNYNYSIISNNTISLSPNVFAYRFTFESDLSDLSNFGVSFSEPIKLENDTGDLYFNFNGTQYHYYYSISTGNLLIYSSNTFASNTLKHTVTQGDLTRGFKFDADSRELSHISYITCTFKTSETLLTLKLYDGSNRTFNFYFKKPLTKFANQEEPIIKFLCKGQDAGQDENGYQPTWLPSERTYQSVTIKFFKNYTEDNPLYFNVNLNGFTYFYEIFVRNGLAVLKYSGPSETDSNSYVSSEKTYEVFNEQLSEGSPFEIEFNEIGRYELEIYDKTYNANLSKEENALASANYYSTSFYIYDSSKTYENVYIVSESYDNGNQLDYIVSNSSQTATVNNDIKITFKNLYNLSQDDFEKIKIVVIKTLFTGSIVSKETIYTYETSDFMNSCYENKTDFYIDFIDDARYKINVYFGDNLTPIITSSYEVVKQPKTIFQVGNEGDPWYEKYIETKPYTKTEKTYYVPLSSQISLNISYFNADGTFVTELKENSTFKKTYWNKFTIFFGIAEVKIYKYTRMVKEGGEETAATTLDIQIDAVGKIEVKIYRDGELYQTQSFRENEKSVLSFSEYGEYSVYVVDEMGTTGSAAFSYQKGLNSSAIILIVLSLVLILAIVLFILKSRSKVPTR